MTWGLAQLDRVAFSVPIFAAASMHVVQHDAFRRDLNLDRRDDFTMPGPLPVEVMVRLQQSVSRPAPYVD